MVWYVVIRETHNYNDKKTIYRTKLKIDPTDSTNIFISTY